MADQIATRTARWERFLSDDSAGHLFTVHYGPDQEARPLPWRDLLDERVEWAWRKYKRQMARIEWLRDDMLPFLDVYTGTEIFAEAFGCPVYYADDNMPFALPLVTTAAEADALRIPEVSHSSVTYLFDIADELRRRAGPRALVRLVDIQSPMDIAALIWEKSSFYPALIEAPSAVQALAGKVKAFLVAFLDEWMGRYGPAYIAHYPEYYMPGGLTLSEDEVGAVSKRVYQELFHPELVELSRCYGGIGVHCCAHARHQWDGFAEIPGLRLINLVQPEEVLREAYERFVRIPQMHSWCGDGEPWTWPEQYPDGARVVMRVPAGTRDEALRLSERMWEACGRIG